MRALTINTTSMESQGFEKPAPKTVEEMANLSFVWKGKSLGVNETSAPC